MKKKVLYFLLSATALNSAFAYIISKIDITTINNLYYKIISFLLNKDISSFYLEDISIKISLICSGIISFFLLSSIIFLSIYFKLSKKSYKEAVVFLTKSIAIIFLANIIRLYIIFAFSTSKKIFYILHSASWFFLAFIIFLLWYFFENNAP